MYISTLSSHIEAIGGELEVIAKFPDGVMKIKNLAELACDLVVSGKRTSVASTISQTVYALS